MSLPPAILTLDAQGRPLPQSDQTVADILEAAMDAGEKTVTLATSTLALMIANHKAAIEDYQDLETGVCLAQGVVENWSSGDLAGAVNGLEGWVEEVTTRRPELTPEPLGDSDED